MRYVPAVLPVLQLAALVLFAGDAPRMVVAVLPVEVAPGVAIPGDGARMLARALATRLAERAGWTVISMDDVEALLQHQHDAQAAGCNDVDTCALELGGALGAQRVVSGRLESRQGDLSWVASVAALDGTVTARATLRGRSWDALATRADDLALMLLGQAPAQQLAGREAQRRLGFAHRDEYRDFLAAHRKQPDVNLADSLTGYILAHNRESRALMWVEAALLAGAPALLIADVALLLVGSWVISWGVPGALFVGAAGCFSCAACPAALGMSMAGAVLTVIDLFDVGRVSVRRKGCCRNPDPLIEAERPDRLARATAMAVGLAGPMALPVIILGELTMFPALTAGFITFMPVRERLGPLGRYDTPYTCMPGVCAFLNCLALPFCALVVGPIVTAAGTSLSLWPERQLLDGAGDGMEAAP